MAEHEVRALSKIEAWVQGEREARVLNQGDLPEFLRWPSTKCES